MTIVTRCDPPLPLDTPNGPGLAHWRIERGPEMPTAYEVWITSGAHTGEIWEFEQTVIRAQANVTVGRPPQFDQASAQAALAEYQRVSAAAG